MSETTKESGPFETTYREALGMAIADAMDENENVVVMGEEVGRYGGAYGVTRGLFERFGADRVIDTPISEPAIVGAAVGAAMTGLRPIAELMYVDFISMSMDQLGNQAAKIRYMFGGQTGVPMVLRTQGGTGRSAGAQHSQSLEAWIMHTPGLHLAMPATVNDAYHLLRHALTLPDPVVFIEHKGLYTSKGMLDRSTPDAPWGQSVIRRTGTDLWIVTYSRMVHYAEKAADTLAAEGISAGVIDLRTLHPIDLDTVESAVAATGRAMVVSEGVTTAGVASEMAAAIQERCFDFLEEPVLRVGAEDVPIPVSPALEAASIPSAEKIADAGRRLTRHRRVA